MKCPKCGYLGFETGDRCRNCGYDFSLAVPASDPSRELPLHVRDASAAPMADLDLSKPEPREPDRALDLDRLIGGSPTPTDMTVKVAERRAGAQLGARPVVPSATSVSTASPEVRHASASTSPGGLPLFTAPAPSEADDTLLITKPRPVRPPLSVRRATPDIPRLRPRPFRPSRDEAPLNLQTDDLDPAALDPDAEAEVDVVAPLRETLTGQGHAGPVARFGAMVIDAAVLGTINAAVVYLTLAMTGLTMSDLIAPAIAAPLGAFLLLVNGAYLMAFTAAGGQTIGKMLAGIRVVNDDGGRVGLTSAALRAAGILASLLTAGIGYIPALFTADARALHDRVAGTRVVRRR